MKLAQSSSQIMIHVASVVLSKPRFSGVSEAILSKRSASSICDYRPPMVEGNAEFFSCRAFMACPQIRFMSCSFQQCCIEAATHSKDHGGCTACTGSEWLLRLISQEIGISKSRKRQQFEKNKTKRRVSSQNGNCSLKEKLSTLLLLFARTKLFFAVKCTIHH